MVRDRSGPAGVKQNARPSCGSIDICAAELGRRRSGRGGRATVSRTHLMRPGAISGPTAVHGVGTGHAWGTWSCLERGCGLCVLPSWSRNWCPHPYPHTRGGQRLATLHKLGQLVIGTSGACLLWYLYIKVTAANRINGAKNKHKSAPITYNGFSAKFLRSAPKFRGG
jgi:hypothetical protein